MDRSEVSRALAKYLAYKNAGKQEQTIEWGGVLIDLLDLPSEVLEALSMKTR